MGHDQLFKEFLQAFLREFLELFCPEVAARLNFDTIRFADKEVFTDFPEGSRREADIVAEVETRDGDPELVLIHVEVQANRKAEFRRRMFQYYALLWHGYQRPVLPIVVYLRGGANGSTEEEFRVSLFGREQLRFRYLAVALARLDAEEYLEKGSPAGAALAALMRRSSARDPLKLRAAMFDGVVRSSLDDARKFLLWNLIQTYFELTADDEARFRRLLASGGYQEVRAMEVTWADKMREKYKAEGLEEGRQEGRVKGRAEGRAEGRLEAKRETLLRLLSAKFGPLSPETEARVDAVGSIEELDAYLERLLTATRLDDVGLTG